MKIQKKRSMGAKARNWKAEYALMAKSLADAADRAIKMEYELDQFLAIATKEFRMSLEVKEQDDADKAERASERRREQEFENRFQGLTPEGDLY
jgi:hypothetical protein